MARGRESPSHWPARGVAVSADLPGQVQAALKSPAPQSLSGASAKTVAPNWLLLLPLAFTTIVVLGAWLLYHTFALEYAKGTKLGIPDATPLPQSASEAANRLVGNLTWVTLLIGSLTVALAAASIIVYIIWQILRADKANARCRGLLANTGWGPLFLLIGIFSVAAIIVVTVVDYTPLHDPLIRPTLQKAGALRVDVWQRRFDRADQVAALFLAAFAGLILPSPKSTDPQYLRERTTSLNLLLTIGTALLVTDVVRTDALFRWASAFINPQDTTALGNFQTVAVTIISVRGLLGTILLASIYLPAAVLMRERVRAAAFAAVKISSMTEVHRWLHEQGLVAPAGVAQLRPILALLAPLLAGLLTGPAAEVLRNLSQTR